MTKKSSHLIQEKQSSAGALQKIRLDIKCVLFSQMDGFFLFFFNIHRMRVRMELSQEMVYKAESWCLWHSVGWKSSFLSKTILRVSIYTWMMEVERVIFSQSCSVGGSFAGRGPVIHIISLFNNSAWKDPHSRIPLWFFVFSFARLRGCGGDVVSSADAGRLHDQHPSDEHLNKACGQTPHSQKLPVANLATTIAPFCTGARVTSF